MNITSKICPLCGTRMKRPRAEPKTIIGKRRAELGLSLQQVANMAGITKAAIWEIETKPANPKMKTLEGLAKALQWTVTEVCDALAAEKKREAA